MDRTKTYNSTGVAPDGRLYAGDMNLLQDLVAALADFAQTIKLGTLAVGENGLTLSRYGAGEMALAGAIRISSLLRAGGGVMFANMTSAVRDAIPVGFAPKGTEIFNTDFDRLEVNKGTDGARVWVAAGTAQLDRAYMAGDKTLIAGTHTGESTALTLVTGNSVTYPNAEVEVDYSFSNVWKNAAPGGSGDEIENGVIVLLRDSGIVGWRAFSTNNRNLATSRGVSVQGSFFDVPPAGAHVYTLKAFTNNVGIVFDDDSGGSGHFVPSWLRVRLT